MALYLRFLIFMKKWIKKYFIELAAWTIILALVGTGAYSWHKITNWSEATIDNLEPAVTSDPAPAAHPIYTAPASLPLKYEPSQPTFVEEPDGPSRWYGTASWYDYKIESDGRGVPCYISRERCYTEDKLFAASRDYPRGTKLLVSRLDDYATPEGRTVVITVTDFGPEEALHPGRVIDLTSYAFSQIADLSEGLIEVRVEEWEIDSADGGIGYGEDGYYSTNPLP